MEPAQSMNDLLVFVAVIILLGIVFLVMRRSAGRKRRELRRKSRFRRD